MARLYGDENFDIKSMGLLKNFNYYAAFRAALIIPNIARNTNRR